MSRLHSSILFFDIKKSSVHPLGSAWGQLASNVLLSKIKFKTNFKMLTELSNVKQRKRILSKKEFDDIK